jgi:hypothetical protein
MSRKIEDAMVNAIRNRKEWTRGNTMVDFTGAERFAQIFLHGNQIGSYDYQSGALTVSLAGWNTNTTRSRVSALCRAFGNTLGVSNNQRKGGPMLINKDGSHTLINSTDWVNG